jgi:hypothetical protein
MLRFVVRVMAQTCVALVYLTVPAFPQTPARPPACTAPEHRQFDFWVGEWQVTLPNGQVAGTNRIESIDGGCTLLENWTGARGMTGHSLNFYEPAKKQWRQLWRDGAGNTLELSGALVDSAMVMGGEVADSTGAITRHRITWSKLVDGRVRQHWQTSADDGKTWNDAFVGFYARRTDATRKP